MARPSDWSPVDMDRDPTPGEPDEVRQLADELQEFADDVGEALGKVRGLAGERAMLDWAGLSADAFRREFDGVPDNLAKLEDSYSLCSQALQTYWPKLQTAQGMADRALDRAVAAQADLASAQSALGDATDWVGRAGEEAERLQREGERTDAEPPDEADVRAATRDHQAAEAAAGAARSRVADAEERLAAARQLALDAQEMREDAARECARGIEDASDAGIQNRKWWEKAIKWVTDNWDTIVAVCKVIVAVLGIVVMIIGGPLAWVVLAAALVVLADTLLKYARGEASLLDVAFAALDCIPGFKGLTTLGGLARGIRGLATTGLRGLSLGAAGLGRGVRHLGRELATLFCRTDPIDMATGEVVMSDVDLRLPGVPPLVVERHHRGSVRTGRAFGPSWSSTLDQRLLLGEGGVRLVTPDGMVLEYPRPLPDEPVLPVEGPRWPLSWNGDPGTPMAVRHRPTGQTLHFAPVPGRRGGELPLVALVDPHGNRVAVEYDAAGDPNALRHDGGYHVGISTERGRVTELRLLSDPERPVLRRFGYDAGGDLTEVVDSSGLPQRLTYDAAHRLTGWEDREGTWYRYRYDDAGRCVGTEGSGGYLNSSIAYDPDTHRTHFTDSLGHTTVYQFDDNYQLVAETDPLGHTTRRTWDRYDRPLSIVDPLGHATHHRYDERGNLIRATRPDGGEITVAYDEHDHPTRVTGADGLTWTHTYDAAGRRTAVTDPAGATTRYTYDQRGHPVASTDPRGATTRVETEDRGLPVAVRHPTGAVTRYRYDAAGRLTETIDADGAVTRTEWTPEGRPTRQIGPDGREQRWRWDAEGRCLRHTDAAGGTVAYRYGPFGLLAEKTGSDGSRTVFGRDTESRVRTVTNSLGLTWEYQYDAAGNRVLERDYDGRETRFVHDPLGQLVERVNPLGQRVRMRRDAMGRLVERDADGRRSTFQHDAAGRLVGAVSPDAEVRFEHDALGRPLTESTGRHTVALRYDGHGRLAERTTPGGVVSAWHYDEHGLPASLTTAGRVVTFTHDPLGRETRRAFGPAGAPPLAFDAVFDPDGQLAEQRLDIAGRPTRHRAYTYRADGYPTAVTDSRDGRTELDLDAAGRVVERRTPGGAERYVYDAAGNQLHAGWPAGAETPAADAAGDRAYTGNTLRQAGRTHYTHDAAGRLVARRRTRLSRKPEHWAYEWNAEDQLTALTTPDGARWEYQYDALGRRVAKQRLAEDGVTVVERTEFVWSGTQLVEQHTVLGGSTEPDVRTWEYRGLRPLLQIDGQAEQDAVDREFYALVTDLVGAPEELLDEHGETVWSARGTLWGRAAPPEPDAPHTPLRFPGQYADAESGLHYNVHRYYDPDTARYLSSDPLGLKPAPNPHIYPHNPLIWADPLGLACTRMVDLYHGTFSAAADNIRTTGIDLSIGRAAGDFGTGGFYVTNNATQAQEWAARLAARRGGTAEVLHYRVPETELNRLSSLRFDSANSEWADFVLHHRGGGAMHDYDMVEGPLLLNPDDFVAGLAPPDAGGHQIAIFTPDAVDLFNRSLR
ncbi:RHS repeat-associated core domain-containing protein [Streptomyces sp. DSM 44915]|uniref:RHS repeat-associated core domain-containing protein n=1 Tax=Streptomyces chisholmiae TaxID=3075540 RepID=A0ABU2JPH9_9ACTN|nr:DUF6531 domain-containing protein [Streptomyces sp. DSM 44915]MDT0266885.1 RHS repeat-associated core domain-containing protein [Streptomyces sp. DSM 44915]